MKATKKQISEVTAEATKQGVNIESALKTLSNCSLSIYKAIGAEGVVRSSIKAKEATRAAFLGGISFNACEVLKVSDKAFYLVIPNGLHTVEKWIAKSIIVDDVIPAWALK